MQSKWHFNHAANAQLLQDSLSDNLQETELLQVVEIPEFNLADIQYPQPNIRNIPLN